MSATAVEVRDLRVELTGRNADVVDEISLDIRPGEVLGLVGESGSGKTTVGMALLGHVRRGGAVGGGAVIIDGRDLAHLGDLDLRRLRGGTVAYIPQDPGTSLNPALRLRTQLSEMLEAHMPDWSDERASWGCARSSASLAQLPMITRCCPMLSCSSPARRLRSFSCDEMSWRENSACTA